MRSGVEQRLRLESLRKRWTHVAFAALTRRVRPSVHLHVANGFAGACQLHALLPAYAVLVAGVSDSTEQADFAAQLVRQAGAWHLELDYRAPRLIEPHLVFVRYPNS